MIKVQILDLDLKQFKVLEDYYITVNKEGDRVRIPSGFITDLAFIPSFFFWFQLYESFKAVLVLKHLYFHGFIYILPFASRYEYKSYFNRQKADELFYSLLRFEGVNPVLAYLMFLAVRVLASHQYWLTPIE